MLLYLIGHLVKEKRNVQKGKAFSNVVGRGFDSVSSAGITAVLSEQFLPNLPSTSVESTPSSLISTQTSAPTATASAVTMAVISPTAVPAEAETCGEIEYPWPTLTFEDGWKILASTKACTNGSESIKYYFFTITNQGLERSLFVFDSTGRHLEPFSAGQTQTFTLTELRQKYKGDIFLKGDKFVWNIPANLIGR